MTARLSTGRFFGETLRRQRYDRYTVSEVRYPGGIRIPEHSHERPIVNFVLAGRYTAVLKVRPENGPEKELRRSEIAVVAGQRTTIR